VRCGNKNAIFLQLYGCIIMIRVVAFLGPFMVAALGGDFNRIDLDRSLAIG
jgi:hypothetical protein